MTFALWLFSLLPFASSQDTLALAEVAVHASAVDRFASGQKLLSYDRATLQRYTSRSLADLLQETSPIFVRQYGAGMLASPSFRGTSPGHTALFWNGIPINSLSLGQSDLSILPVQALDRVELHFGSGGALFGNEAIGGSIHLSTAAPQDPGFRAMLSQTFSSFGGSQSAVSTGYSSPKFKVQSQVYRQYQANAFTYHDFTLRGTPLRTQEHAASRQLGMVQDLQWQPSKNARWKASLWWHQADRQIQPLMGSSTRDRQLDQSTRLVIDYLHAGPRSLWKVKGAWVGDQLRFNAQDNTTQQAITGLEWEKVSQGNWALRAGLRATFAQAELSSYRKEEWRVEAYQSATWSLENKIAVSFNARQLSYAGYTQPFLPSLGLEWQLHQKEGQELLLKASASKGFKLPTLNDRFWNPGGNPLLRPERSRSGEFGLHWTQEGDLSWELGIGYYRMLVDDWIVWLPKGPIWSPENIREVDNQGLEYQGKSSWKTGSWNWALGLSYTYSRARDAEDTSRQLPYSPVHQGNGQVQLSRKHLGLELSSSYVGARSIASGGSRTLPGYQLVNAGLSYSGLQWKKVRLPLQLQVLNLLNQSYQVMYLRAMPGRSYQLNITLSI